MGKKRAKPNHDKADRAKRRKPQPTNGSGDPLGKLIQQFGVNPAEVLVTFAILAVIGGGIVAYALSREPDSLTWLLIGGAVLLMAGVLLVTNLLNLGRRLELRKDGVRFTESGAVTEFGWNEIVAVEVNRLDDTYLGVASVQKRSTDAVNPSSPLTKTEWDVTLRAHDDRTIRLRPTFFRIVPDPKKLISQLRLGAGLK